uniref:Phosphoinositide interacting regulator of transient receptor potential channels n=1 Tax=Salmo trutta TaxID=8032 RepID=A0A674CRM2_SALTR
FLIEYKALECTGEELPRTEDSVRRVLCPELDPNTPEPPRWAYIHKPIIVMVMGALMLGAGAVLILLHSSGVTDTPHATAPVCLSIGMMFVVVGLVWIPILKDKQRRMGLGARSTSRSLSSV